MVETVGGVIHHAPNCKGWEDVAMPILKVVCYESGEWDLTKARVLEAGTSRKPRSASSALRSEL